MELDDRREMRARRVGLVGCVKDKAGTSAPARDLYTSTLFAGRRDFVERSCDGWWILSAAHGLVHPDRELAPYDVALKGQPRDRLRAWSHAVLEAIDGEIRTRPGDVFEIHAGAEYRNFGLLVGLEERGCTVVVPTASMSFGRQLQFYTEARGDRRV